MGALRRTGAACDRASRRGASELVLVYPFQTEIITGRHLLHGIILHITIIDDKNLSGRHGDCRKRTLAPHWGPSVACIRNVFEEQFSCHFGIKGSLRTFISIRASQRARLFSTFTVPRRGPSAISGWISVGAHATASFPAKGRSMLAHLFPLSAL